MKPNSNSSKAILRWVGGRDPSIPRSDLYPEIAKTPGPILPEGFVFLAGQPDEVRRAYRRAMGLDAESARDVHARGQNVSA